MIAHGDNLEKFERELIARLKGKAFKLSDQRADGVAGLLTPEDAAELTSDNEIVREKWIDPNVRVTYRVMTYDLV